MKHYDKTLVPPLKLGITNEHFYMSTFFFREYRILIAVIKSYSQIKIGVLWA